MSEDTPTNPLVDLSNLRLMPDWVANFGNDARRRADNAEDEGPSREGREYRDPRGREQGGRRPFGGGRDRGDGGRRPFGGGGQGDRERRGGGQQGGGRPRGEGGPGFRRDREGPGRGGFAPREERPQIPSGVKVTIEPEERSLDALAQHIKSQGRAFSLFDAARLVLAGVERHQIHFECEAERLVGLFKVEGDNALFETREEALRHVVKSPEALASYYKAEEIELEEPKGNFTSVAVCGMSGEVLGPPSHHSYQTALKRLHNERFGHLPFEDYKRRVQVKSDPDFVQKWKDQQRKGTRWTWLKGEAAEEGTEPVTFQTAAEVEAHFRRTHGDSAVAEVRSHIIHGNVRREQLSPGLGRLFRRTLEDTRKHLFDLSQRIAHGLERRGLKLFKRRSGKLFVSRIKPRAIDPSVVFSERVAQIVEHIRKEPGVQAAKLLEDLAPSPAPAEGTAESADKVLTEEQKTVIRDLRWLADEGYVIEYSDGPVFLGIQGDPPNAKPAAPAGAEAKVEAPDEQVEAAAEALVETEESGPAEAEPVASPEACEADAANEEAEVTPPADAEVAESAAPPEKAE